MITTKKVTKTELTNSIKSINDNQPTIITPVTIKSYSDVMIILKKLVNSFPSITIIVIKN
jgi:hypothetical protein